MAIDKEQVLDALRQVIDPELGINIVDMGLIYGIEIQGDRVHVKMTLTTPGCPMSAPLVAMADAAIREGVPEAETVEIELVWEPPWDPSRLSEIAKKKLGLPTE